MKRSSTMEEKRPSGGARAVEAKHLERAAKRGPEYEDEWKAAVADLGPAPDDPVKAFTWTAKVLAFALQSAISDAGLPPEQRREQAGRIAPQLIKALEPARLAAQLEKYERALEELNAAPVDAPADGGSGQAASIC